jgi:hypothetical protein
MAKFLRFIAGYHDPEIEQAIGGAGAVYLFPMYQYYATPLRTEDCAKLNVCFRRRVAQSAPSLALGVATVERLFDFDAFSKLPTLTQRRWVLDELHDAVLFAGKHFGWPMDRAQEAYAQIVRNALQFEFTWGKPKSNPSRSLRVQIQVDFADSVRLDVMFFDPKGHLILRKPFSVLGPGLGIVAFVLGKIEWLDDRNVRITHQNGQNYWICRTDGTLHFFCPRAESGDAQGMFNLGRMYCEGQYVLRDPVLGRQFLEAAAKQGYKHAVSYLRRQVEPGAAPNGDPAKRVGNSGLTEGPPSVS